MPYDNPWAPASPEETDALAPIRGIVIGLGISAFLWIWIAAVATAIATRIFT
jgi:hypothetical protein